MSKIPTICIGEDDTHPVDLFRQLEQLGFAVTRKVYPFAEAVEALAQPVEPVLAVIDLGSDMEKAFDFVERIQADLRHVYIIVTSSDQSSSTVLRALRSGAGEFLTQPFEPTEVREALERIQKRIELQPAPAQQKTTGSILAVFSNKGGVGTTTVATNLAVALASKETPKKSVCLVDLDLQFGSVNSCLNLNAQYTIVDMIKNHDRLDPMFLEGSLAKHASGARILAAPNFTEEADSITATDVDRLLDFLTNEFDFVILDCAKRIHETTLCVLQKSRLILFVTQLDVPSVNLTRRALDFFERIQLPLSKVRMIVNHYVKSNTITLEAVEKTLGIKPSWLLPWDREVTVSALNQGLSVMETQSKAKISRGFRRLADEVGEAVASPGSDQQGSRKGAGVLSRWLPKFA